MKCEKFKELLSDYSLNEIPANVRGTMEAHRNECVECAVLWEDYQAFSAMFRHMPEPQVSDEDMDRLHGRIMDSVRREQFRTYADPVKEKRGLSMKPWWNTVAVAAATLVFGLFVGRFISGGGAGGPAVMPGQTASVAPEGFDIEDIRIQVVNHTTGDLEIEYSQKQDRKVSGNVNDPYIQKLLAYAMVKDENPGTRLRSVKLSTEMQAGDEILDALMTTVRGDDNNGVRLKAMKALREFPLTEAIKDLCVDVIANDDYPAMRMEAIQILTNSSETIEADEESVLKKAAEEDDAEGVRSLIRQYYNNLQGNPLEKR